MITGGNIRHSNAYIKMTKLWWEHILTTVQMRPLFIQLPNTTSGLPKCIHVKLLKMKKYCFSWTKNVQATVQVNNLKQIQFQYVDVRHNSVYTVNSVYSLCFSLFVIIMRIIAYFVCIDHTALYGRLNWQIYWFLFLF
jgi:hypothetical protein